MPVKKCPLCLETKNVVVSHMMPAAMYDYCRPPGGHNLSVSSDLVIESDRQLKHSLLCNDCEQNLNRGGETWILPLLARYKGPFPFHDLLTKIAPDVVDGDVKAYAAARNPEIDCEKIIHFALGIFWKAGVHSWNRSRTAPLINLGVYAEPIRRFLRGEQGCPESIALTIGVLPPPVELISFHNPYRGSNPSWPNFLFYVSGIEFALHLGPPVDSGIRESCFATNPLHPMMVLDFSPTIKDILSEVWKKAHKAKNVEKYLKRH